MKKIRKAVFPVAGLGSRFLPATKALPKELLPIVDRPLIQYAVEEVIKAGMDTLIFVTGRNKRAIEDHFDKNWELENALLAKGENEKADLVRSILPNHVECIFVRQKMQLGLGDAIFCAERAVAGEPFVVSLADDFISSDNSGVTKKLIDQFEKTQKMQLAVIPVHGPEISKYGVIETGSNEKNVLSIVEKPPFEKAPSNLASIGRYVLTSDIFDTLRHQSPGLNGEIQLSDAIDVYAKQGRVQAYKIEDKRFDCGSVEGYLQAIMYEAKKQKLFDEK